ncbi:hypothetical protein D3C86_1258050 [compost metagenome]
MIRPVQLERLPGPVRGQSDDGRSHHPSLRAARGPDPRHDRQRHAGTRHASAVRAHHQRAARHQHLDGAAGLSLAGRPRHSGGPAAVGLLCGGHAGRNACTAVHVTPALEGIDGVHQRRRGRAAGARVQLGTRAAGLRRAGRGRAAIEPARPGDGACRTPARRTPQRLRVAAWRPATAPRNLPAGDARRACAVAGRRDRHQRLHGSGDPRTDRRRQAGRHRRGRIAHLLRASAHARGAGPEGARASHRSDHRRQCRRARPAARRRAGGGLHAVVELQQPPGLADARGTQARTAGAAGAA